MIRPDCRLSAKPSALSRHRYFVSHCAPSNYKKVVSADTPNPCTQPTRHSCNNLISNLLQSPGVGRHHTNLHSADTGMIVTKLYSPRSTSPRSTSPRSSSPRFSSPRFSSPHLTSPRFSSPRLAPPHLASSRLASPRSTSLRFSVASPYNKTSPREYSRGLALYDNLFRLSD